ncbi:MULTISPECIES: protein disulfide oxidoreductase [Limnochorda]|uniref:protein disulfide oxidoreductase n=1 Tax=Limnochorda TaxID=1676651 RepID=UPI00180EA125|nr:thioredoxin family protein [Limnochorda pilosa]MBO2487333.1 glutaredoxin [Bacillota bacterium]MBO2520092.1 glutaredoxin [Bacillota bacterium]NMA70772.1 glutaredoxin [Bacillota bacterium]
MALLSEKDAQYVRGFFDEHLENPVEILLFTAAEGDELAARKNPYLKETEELIKTVAGLSDKLSLTIYRRGTDDETFEAYGIREVPATVLQGPGGIDYGIRFYGIPAGYEFRTLMEDLVDVSRGTTSLSEKTKEALQSLAVDAHIQVFVTPTCPYCPKAVRIAHQFAIESPRVRADMVEATEFPDWSQKYGVFGVPKTVINDVEEIEGAVPEEFVLEALLRATAVKA